MPRFHYPGEISLLYKIISLWKGKFLRWNALLYHAFCTLMDVQYKLQSQINGWREHFHSKWNVILLVTYNVHLTSKFYVTRYLEDVQCRSSILPILPFTMTLRREMYVLFNINDLDPNIKTALLPQCGWVNLFHIIAVSPHLPDYNSSKWRRLRWK